MCTLIKPTHCELVVHPERVRGPCREQSWYDPVVPSNPHSGLVS